MDNRHRCRELSVVSWDLQTGGVASVIRWEGPRRENAGNTSITYSANGKMVAVFRWYRGNPSASIFIFDAASGIHMHSHSLNNHIPLADGIWTYGESLRFATVRAGTVTIWGVGFTSGATPTKIETLPAPDGYKNIQGSLRLLPTPRRLALASEHQVLVHDVRDPEYLRHRLGARFSTRMSFSSGGRFFACSSESKIYLWKESPDGYTLHEILESSSDHPNPLLSPNGESIAVVGDHTIQLYHTRSLITTSSSIPTRAPRRAEDSVLVFSPDGTLAVFVRRGDNTVTVLNTMSGVLQLNINTGMGVDGLRVIGKTVVVIGFGKVIAWDLPAGDRVPGATVGPRDGFRKVQFNTQSPFTSGASISSDSRHVAVISRQYPHCLAIYSAFTREHLGETSIDGTTPGTTLWFSPDGCDVWCVRESSEARRVWRVSGGQKALEVLDSEWRTVDVEGYPWRSSHGYQVTTDWWILGPDRKRLLMLPPPFQSHAVHRVWKGRFLALLHGGLSEPVILELDP